MATNVNLHSIASEHAHFSDEQVRQMNEFDFYYNPGFLDRFALRFDCPANISDRITLFTMKRVADFVLENNNAMIPPHGMGIFQPHTCSARQYIRGTNDFEFPLTVYAHLFQLTGKPLEAQDPLIIFEEGDKVFESEAVPKEVKAQAIYMAIRDTLR